MFVSRVVATRKREVNRTIANTRFTAGPAPIATSRRHVACRQYASGASAISCSCHMRVSPSCGRSSSSASRAAGSSPLPSALSSRASSGASSCCISGRSVARKSPGDAGSCRGSSRSRQAGTYRIRTRRHCVAALRAAARSRGRTSAASSRRRARRRSGPPRDRHEQCQNRRRGAKLKNRDQIASRASASRNRQDHAQAEPSTRARDVLD